MTGDETGQTAADEVIVINHHHVSAAFGLENSGEYAAPFVQTDAVTESFKVVIPLLKHGIWGELDTLDHKVVRQWRQIRTVICNDNSAPA